MPWWTPQELIRRRALTAAAQIVVPTSTPTIDQPAQIPAGRPLYRTADSWQREVWDFYDTSGEFRQGVTWKANMLSRVRLRAAKIQDVQDEPEIVTASAPLDIRYPCGTVN